jgi:uncharacterized membrane protein YkvA (DUF1232 family)
MVFSPIAEPAFIAAMTRAKRRKTPKARRTAKPKSRRTKIAKQTTVLREYRRPAHEKAAIRSDAFAKAILEAKSYRDDPDSLAELFEHASSKVAAIPKTALNELGPYLHCMLRLVRAYGRGEYRAIAKGTLLTIVAAISYLVDPFDLIPDEVPFLGFVDDATVIGFAVTRTRDALDEFMMWETRVA